MIDVTAIEPKPQTIKALIFWARGVWTGFLWNVQAFFLHLRAELFFEKSPLLAAWGAQAVSNSALNLCCLRVLFFNVLPPFLDGQPLDCGSVLVTK